MAMQPPILREGREPWVLDLTQSLRPLGPLASFLTLQLSARRAALEGGPSNLCPRLHSQSQGPQDLTKASASL